jgi:hypothetical protein
MKTVIIINGQGGSGKDTFVEYCQNYLQSKPFAVINNIYNISTVDKIKEAATILGWDGQKRPEDRKFLSDLKDLSTEYSNHSFKYVIDFVNQVNDDTVVFVHCREPKEILKLKSHYEGEDVIFYRLLINRETNENYENHADLNVNNVEYEYEVDNFFSKDRFKNEAEVFCDLLIGD